MVLDYFAGRSRFNAEPWQLLALHHCGGSSNHTTSVMSSAFIHSTSIPIPWERVNWSAQRLKLELVQSLLPIRTCTATIHHEVRAL